MASVWKLICPKHNTELVTEKTIPFNEDGVVSRHPLFFCDECKLYYIHTDATMKNSRLEYGEYEVINTDSKFYEVFDSELILNPDSIRSYDEPFIPVKCYKDDRILVKKFNVDVVAGEFRGLLSGFYCLECEDFYIESEIYDEISDQIKSIVRREFLDTTYKQTDNKKEQQIVKRYSFEELLPDSKRMELEEVKKYLGSYETCEANYNKRFPYSLLHYAFVFRRLDVVNEMLGVLNDEELVTAVHFTGTTSYEWITPLVCAKWNLNYINAYDDKNSTRIIEKLEQFLPEVEHIDEIVEYTDVVGKDGENIFDIFWEDIQPVLDVVYYDKQELASKQVEKKKISIVMDEVGTGKTVSALYAIRNVINIKRVRHDFAKILIVCPYNKREDWQNDIRRQLGRYAHIVEQGDNGHMYEGALKKVFFKGSEDVVFITGPKQGTDLEGSYTALKGTILEYSKNERWDLVIIDEGHISFKNYQGIDSERAMLLSATPIVVNAKERRTFEDYIALLQKITGTLVVSRDIDPISRCMPTEEDIYVNWFREDMGKSTAERRIRFVACKRHQDRDEIFYRIKDEVGALAALQYDQDDNYLFDAAKNRYGFSNVKEIRKNGKLERLVDLLKENSKSYIIFCEHQFVVDLIFKRLKDDFASDIIAEKYGKFENQYGLGNIQDGQLINTLMQALRNNRRVIFVTTGKTGGTGLNLGEFDGVIHYELPFTSIELEQRFGRVDRIDTNISSKNRDMFFMLNECKADENDMEINRMLYYCTTKIDITCQYMPIRNTILYYPEFVGRNWRAIRESLVYLQNEHVLSIENEKKIKAIRRKRRQYENDIRKSEYWENIQDYGKTVRDCVLSVLRIEKSDLISDEQYDYMGVYIEFLKETKADRNEYERVYRKFLEAKKNVNYWLAIVGLIEVEEDSEIFVGYGASEDGDDVPISVEEETINKDAMKEIMPVQKQILELIKLIDESDFENAELKGFSSEGIFCYVDNTIKRSKVLDYRNNKGWD